MRIRGQDVPFGFPSETAFGFAGILNQAYFFAGQLNADLAHSSAQQGAART